MFTKVEKELYNDIKKAGLQDKIGKLTDEDITNIVKEVKAKLA